jgi:hypothetical protein
MPSYGDLFRRLALVFVNTMSSLDFPRPLPPTVKYLEGVVEDRPDEHVYVLDKVGEGEN